MWRRILMLEDSILQHKSKPPLRWIANLFGEIGSWAIMHVADLDDQRNFGWRYKIYSKIYGIFMPAYYNYGSFYIWQPYWERTGTVDPDYDYDEFHWDYIDEETGDAFKVINFGGKE
jgi:hypothetical protein